MGTMAISEQHAATACSPVVPGDTSGSQRLHLFSDSWGEPHQPTRARSIEYCASASATTHAESEQPRRNEGAEPAGTHSTDLIGGGDRIP